MISGVQRTLARHKGLSDPAALDAWHGPELLSFGWTFVSRAMRGLLLRLRLGPCKGLVLCERGVVISHGRHISAGRCLNIEQGCHIVGLAKRGIVFGDRCTVRSFASIRPTNVLLGEPGEGLRMGNHSNIGSYSYIGCSGYIEIGDNVMMGPHVNLLAENHVFERTDVTIKEQGVERSFIRIEDDCWIGASSTIVAGVTVGQGSVVAAGSVVTRDVEPFSVVGGVPAEVIRSRK